MKAPGSIKHTMHNPKQGGFSLMELMVTLTVAAIIMGIAAPSFMEFRRNGRLAESANDFLGVIQTARSEAIKRQATVSVCPSNNPTDPAATCATSNWNSAGAGWIAFAESPTEINCQRSNSTLPIVRLPDGSTLTPKESDANSLIRTGVADPLVFVRSNGSCISFGPTGFLVTVAGRTTAGATFMWDRDFPVSGKCVAQPGASTLSRAREVVVTNTGRSRITRLKTEIDADLTASGVTCP